MALLLIATALLGCAGAEFSPLQHLGGNSPWFEGPNVFGIDPSPPGGCVVDQAAFTSRHGSRYPDPGAYYEWTNLSAKASQALLKKKLDFLKSWKPVLSHPELQISQLSLGGYAELYEMGVNYRWAYPDFYTENTPFALWANKYSTTVFRVVDSARLFARGYLGPNATTAGEIYSIESKDPRSIANSLAPSDLCPNYEDNGGGASGTTWAEIYLPPIVNRINTLLHGLHFNSSDVNIFPYLCGFETQIAGKRSPWCDVFTDDEILQYEYAQDLRYWYGTGLGTDLEKNMMLPFLTALVQRFVDGPNATYPSNTSSSSFHPNPLIATFTNDGQVNQLAAALGVFDNEAQLPATHIPHNRLFRASRISPMRGTIGFERLNCGRKGLFMRIKLNNAVYPVANYQDGPGRSCGLEKYKGLVAEKMKRFGDFEVACGVANSSVVPPGTERTFLTDVGLPFEEVRAP
ncbi:hypothetical protein M409DRAFT_71657 [Zasmidium cellare ATCC 36951]|uniref:3-phytase n=1 Tax=Zasmidium cellare ATCC 36951 TaxID=1080233 RepID=A0A6A6BUJ9_ZASCE|nr:uncharacterized protein M409DRAFT_71657 [Zasmidium cellare ATCC 36951]KAF2158421.1 hypothetical protein M409DRAFT_71657 [Zasmidium cellare ATCC 36951]